MSDSISKIFYLSFIALFIISCGGGGGSSSSAAGSSSSYGESSSSSAASCTSSATNFCITVAARSVGTGKIYKIDTVAQKSLTLAAGTTYTFDISDSTVSSHPFKLSTTADGTHATPTAGTEYTTGVTAGTTTITFAPTASTPQTLYYYCGSHANMGGTITISGGAVSGYSPPEQINPID